MADSHSAIRPNCNAKPTDITGILGRLCPTSLRRASLSARLWLGAGVIAVFIGTLAAMWAASPAEQRSNATLGLDFIAFYTAGTFVREGRASDLYDLKAVGQFERALAAKEGIALGDAIGPWWNPPFYAWVFVPLSHLAFPSAVRIWIGINVACAVLAVVLLCRILSTARPDQGNGERDGRNAWMTYGLPPVLLTLSMPFIHALTHGQNACMSLLAVTALVMLWRQQKGIAAGMVCGLMFYKPQLGVVLSALLVLDLGWPALAGISISFIALLLATLALPGTLHDFVHRMPANLQVVQEKLPYVWERHVTLLAFWRVLLQGTAIGETHLSVQIMAMACMGAVGAALFWAAWQNTRSTDDRDGMRRDRLITAAIAATPLLMPFYFDYDQVLLAVPAVLLAAEFLRRAHGFPITGSSSAAMERWIVGLWSLHYLWLMLNPQVALVTRVNFAAPIWTAVAMLLIVRAARQVDAAVESVRSLRVENRSHDKRLVEAW